MIRSHLHEVPGAVTFLETVGWWLPGTGVRRDRALVSNGDRASVWEGENVLETAGGDGCASV